MKKILNFVLAATMVCGAAVSLASCNQAQPQKDNSAQQVVSTELIRTSQSWDGVELPDYLQGRPELVAVKYVFPAGQKLGWHHHPVMNYGILVQGELTIIGQDGKEKVVHEGEAVVAAGSSAPGDTIGIVIEHLPQNKIKASRYHDERLYLYVRCFLSNGVEVSQKGHLSTHSLARSELTVNPEVALVEV